MSADFHADKLFLDQPTEIMNQPLPASPAGLIVCPPTMRVRSFRAWKLVDLDDSMNRWLQHNASGIESVLAVTVTPGGGKYCGTICYIPKVTAAT